MDGTKSIHPLSNLVPGIIKYELFPVFPTFLSKFAVQIAVHFHLLLKITLMAREKFEIVSNQNFGKGTSSSY